MKFLQLEWRTLPDVQITLTQEEACVLREICGTIAGSPSDSPRDVTNKISIALRKAGYEWDGQYGGSQWTLSGTIVWAPVTRGDT